MNKSRWNSTETLASKPSPASSNYRLKLLFTTLTSSTSGQSSEQYAALFTDDFNTFEFRVADCKMEAIRVTASSSWLPTRACSTSAMYTSNLGTLSGPTNLYPLLMSWGRALGPQQDPQRQIVSLPVAPRDKSLRMHHYA